MGQLCTFFMICSKWYVHLLTNLHNFHPMVQANGGGKKDKLIRQMKNQIKNLSLQLASQVGYIAESKVARGESTTWVPSRSQPLLGDCTMYMLYICILCAHCMYCLFCILQRARWRGVKPQLGWWADPDLCIFDHFVLMKQ